MIAKYVWEEDNREEWNCLRVTAQRCIGYDIELVQRRLQHSSKLPLSLRELRQRESNTPNCFDSWACCSLIKLHVFRYLMIPIVKQVCSLQQDFIAKIIGWGRKQISIC